MNMFFVENKLNKSYRMVVNTKALKEATIEPDRPHEKNFQ
jgi:hypothetical protein